MKRDRMTWAAERKASAPPATPGYDMEDQDHPAHQPDPAMEKYEKGDPSAWAEDVHQPPYPEGNPPADPGYDVEDQEHPAYKKAPRVPKEASLKAAVEKKAAKCMVVASKMLGKKASAQMVEDQALDLLDMDDGQLDATFDRMGGDFLGFDEMLDEVEVEDEAFPVEDEGIEELLAQDEDAEDEDVEGPMAARIKALEEELACMKGADDQNAPGGDMDAPQASDISEEEAQEPILAMFDSIDSDGDGFVSADEWSGSKAVFASLDTDNDGIIARAEVAAAFGFEEEPEDKDEDEGIEAEDIALLAEMEAEACGCEGDMPVMAAKKSDDKEDDDSDSDDKEDGDSDSDDEGDDDSDSDDEGDEKEGGKKEAGCEKLPEGPMRDNCEKKEEEGDDDKGDKKASDEDAGMFAMTADPMGLGDGSLPEMDGIDDNLLSEVFGGKVAGEDEDDSDDSDDEGDEDEGDDEGGKEASERPQRPKQGSGPKTVGRMTRTASEQDDLSSLWQSAPDVSDVFGTK